MRAVVYYGPHQMREEELPIPRPGAGEVLVKVQAAGICGSDIHGYTGASGRRSAGMVMGHEFAGVAHELGEGVENIQLGDRVAVNPLIYCGECAGCKSHNEQLCRKRKSIGVNMGLVGGFAEFVAAPSRNLVPLADDVTFAEGSMAEPLAVGLRAANIAQPVETEPLVIIGGGTIGLCTLMVCLGRGASPVYVTDVSQHKLELIESLGGKALDARSTDLAALGRETTLGGFEKIIDAVAVSSTLKQALPALALGGTLVLVGLATPLVEIGLYDLVPQERVIKSAYAYSADEYRQAVDMINSRKVDVRPLLEGTCTLAEAPAMFEQMAAGKIEAVKVIVGM